MESHVKTFDTDRISGVRQALARRQKYVLINWQTFCKGLNGKVQMYTEQKTFSRNLAVRSVSVCRQSESAECVRAIGRPFKLCWQPNDRINGTVAELRPFKLILPI